MILSGMQHCHSGHRFHQSAAAFNCCGDDAFDCEQDESGEQKPSPEFLLRFQFG
jgi:hypothetical protein